ncbi:MAG: dihydrolipoyl dehydrogenase, partial [Halobacteriovoraceae bacterium]|nr:dihydrolipoyl dehydrogenase [Halobacteriovoraceae bacterium]
VCLKRGCIPTKAVLRSAQGVFEARELKQLGVDVELKGLNSSVAVKRAMGVADRFCKGVGFLLKKNKVQVIKGKGVLKDNRTVKVAGENIKAKNIILATGAHYKSFPGLKHDGKKIIGAWEAVSMEKLPATMAIIGAGAIGVEFAYFWHAFGVKVHMFELQPCLLPVEDEESSRELERAYKKYGIKMSLGLKGVSVKANAKEVVVGFQDKNAKKQELAFEKCLLAVGMTGNVDDIGLEKVGVTVEKGFVKVDSFYQTSVPGIYAIGDVAGPPLLAHAASHEGIVAVEHLAGLNPHPINPLNIPGCTYCQPQVASVGFTEKALKEKKIKYSVGKLPFSANGKAVASNEASGFCKVLLGEYGELLGAHIVGFHATEMIHEYVLFRTMEGIDEEIMATVHPHPTLGEWLGETVLNAKGRSLNF